MVKQGHFRLRSIIVLVALAATLLSACGGSISTNTSNPSNSTANQLGTYSLPPWWNGKTCDQEHYPEAYLLTTWRGIQVCGPLPWKTTGNKDVTEDFQGHGVFQLEFECPELIARYLLAAYGLDSQRADGWQVVDAYTSLPGTPFHKVVNDGSIHMAPIEGDVLGYGTSDPGHTSIVTNSRVDSNGNGTIDVIEQNVAKSGTAILTMTNWVIQHDSYHIGTVASWMTTRPVSSQPTTNTPNFGPFVGNWFAHGVGMTIRSDGTANYTGRVYVWCSDDPRPPCDSTNNNIITGGLDTQITFISVNGNVAGGTITGGSGDRDKQGNIIPVGSTFTVTLNPSNDTLQASDGVLLCGPNTPQSDPNYPGCVN